MRELVYILCGYLIWNKPIGVKFYLYYFWVFLIGDPLTVKSYNDDWRKEGYSTRQIGENYIKLSPIIFRILRDYIIVPLFIALLIAILAFIYL